MVNMTGITAKIWMWDLPSS